MRFAVRAGCRRHEAGVIYSMAFGDQPALVCDLVDWARSCGFVVTAAGRGHMETGIQIFNTRNHLGLLGLSKQQAERGRLNPKMFNAFRWFKTIDRISSHRQCHGVTCTKMDWPIHLAVLMTFRI